MTEAPKGPYTFRMADTMSFIRTGHAALVRKLTWFIDSSGRIGNTADFNAFLGGIAAIITNHQKDLTLKTPLFDKEIELIKKGWEFRFPTPWGGVANKKLDTDDNAHFNVRKYLVIQQKGMLGFEFHKNKQETLRVKEGLCIGISSIHKAKGWQNGHVTLTFMKPDDTCTLRPGDEHGVIALTKCVVEETATDDTGGDLYFIFPAKQADELQNSS
jgi:hypothetical protein